VERFNKLYPQYKGGFARRVVCDDAYAQTIIQDFKVPDKEPHIAVSVDMLETGIDVPEVVNLVFFKYVRSKTKFWQMIGRGTRLCPNLFGEGQHKTHFLIFDYLGNFEFFRAHKEGIEPPAVPSLTEAIFAKRVRLIQALQEAAYVDEPYQKLRNELIDTVVGQINALNPELIAVKLKLQHVVKFKEKSSFACLSSADVHDLNEHLAPLVYMEEADEHAKSFDNFMYGLMLAQMEAKKAQLKRSRKQLEKTCLELAKRTTIPQIREKIALINDIGTEDFWNSAGILDFERVRLELRNLIKFIMDEGGSKPVIYTNLKDEVLHIKEGQELDPAYDFEDYRQKVNKYIENNRDHVAIYKLRHNIPLTAVDYQTLERIFTGELGTAEDYKREFQDTPFGLLVRRIAKMDYQAACEAFSEFINDQSLSQAQIVFVKKVIDYIVQNGYIDSPADLMKPPFDKPQNLLKLFDTARQKKLINVVNSIKENAVKIIG